MDEVDISVIIPVFNAEEYLSRCVESVVTDKNSLNLEIILVDDGSTDGSGALCDRYAEHNADIRVIHVKHKGVSYARNAGINQARGKYLLFSDADDYFMEHGVSKLYEYAEKHQLEFVFSDIQKIDFNGGIIKKFWGEQSYIAEDIQSLLYGYLQDPRGKNLVSFVWNKLFLRDIVLTNGLRFDVSLKISEDSLFVFQYLPLVRRYGYLRESTYCYCTNQENIGTANMSGDPFAYALPLREIRKTLSDRAVKGSLDAVYYNAFAQLGIRNLFHIIRCYQGSQKGLTELVKKMLSNEELQTAMLFYDGLQSENLRIIPALIKRAGARMLIMAFRFQIFLKKIKKSRREN